MVYISGIRMRDLARSSGLPPSTIRFYLKQGLLPEPQRPATNSALYDQRHLDALEDLKAVKRLAPELPIVQLKRVVELISQGVEPNVALSLHRSVSNGLASKNASQVALTKRELAEKVGVSADLISDLVESGVLVPAGTDEQFDSADVEVAGALALLEAMSPGSYRRAGEIATLIREASRKEMELRNEISAGQNSNVSAEISRQMQEWANFWHAYLFARYRLVEIATHGLGNVSDADEGDNS